MYLLSVGLFRVDEVEKELGVLQDDPEVRYKNIIFFLNYLINLLGLKQEILYVYVLKTWPLGGEGHIYVHQDICIIFYFCPLLFLFLKTKELEGKKKVMLK